MVTLTIQQWIYALERLCEQETGYTGVHEYSDIFESWLKRKSVGELLKYLEELEK